MRPPGPESSHNDCVLVVGVSRPKLAAVFLTVMLISLFLTFHVLYDSAVYSLQVNGINIRNVHRFMFGKRRRKSQRRENKIK